MQPLRKKSKLEFDQDPYLRDIVERNLEIAAQCCIDISHRIISLEKAQKPQDYYEAIMRMGELAVLPVDFARKLTPIAGFRNILIREYLSVDWDEVYKHLQDLNDIIRFADFIREWLRQKAKEDN